VISTNRLAPVAGGCAVIIVNHNAGSLLAESVVSAIASGATEVIVVDNASTDDSVNQLAKIPSNPTLKVMQNANNLGFAKGCNIGVAASRAATLLFLNPDCRLEPNALRRLIGVLGQEEETGMVGPLLLNPDGTEQRGGRRRIPSLTSGFTAAFRLGRLTQVLPSRFRDFNQHTRELPTFPVGVEAISGSCMMMKRAAIESVGPWDEEYFLHVEDLDYCMRFARKGWRILFVPDAVAVHVKGASSSGRPIFVEWHKHKGMVRFLDKFYADRHSLPLMWLVKTGIWFRFALVVVMVTISRLGRRQFSAIKFSW
jgi:GT2 family glycosyltransferase